MSSSSLLSSKYFDKLYVNRLQANDIQSDNIQSDDIIPAQPQYLFSAVFNNAKFVRTHTGGTLSFTKDNTDSIIMFTDRPFRQTETISFELFINLFDSSGNNSFQEDPPNAVLVHQLEQRTYIVTLSTYDNDSATFNLELLPGETHDLDTVEGRMSLFVDSYTKKITYLYNDTIIKENQTLTYKDIVINYKKIINHTNLIITDQLHNLSSSLIINNGTIILKNSATVGNLGTIENYGTIKIENGSTLKINYDVKNDILIKGELNNYNNATIKNDGTIENYGTITNNGTIENDGTIENNSDGTIENYGTIENNQTIDNNSTIQNNFRIYNYKNINNKKNIYNQIIYNKGKISNEDSGSIYGGTIENLNKKATIIPETKNNLHEVIIIYYKN